MVKLSGVDIIFEGRCIELEDKDLGKRPKSYIARLSIWDKTRLMCGPAKVLEHGEMKGACHLCFR